MGEEDKDLRALTLSVVIATAYRERELVNALACLARQTREPDEVIIVDGAPAPGVERLATSEATRLGLPVRYLRWSPPSAAVQRNAGAEQARGDLLVFMDDDAYLEPDCLERIARIFEKDSAREIGGVGVLISNQPCHPPSARARKWFDFLAGEPRRTYSGAVIGPAVNIGPQPVDDGSVIDVEWLTSTCVAYRREAFAAERFCSRFHGYSFMEDVDLSVRVARNWRLAVDTGARIFHDSQPSAFKAPFVRSRMAVCNRYHVMTETLNRRGWAVHGKFLLFHLVSWSSALLRTRTLPDLWMRVQEMVGLVAGMVIVLPAALRNLVHPGTRQ